MQPYCDQNDITIYHGDLLDVLSTLPEASVDNVITDPPYGLSFMGKDWDHGIPGPIYWDTIARVCKPGAMMLAFGGTRTYHRLTCAIEDAGWEICDCLMWLHGQGFPKSLDISKAIDRAAGAVREVVGASRSIDCVERGYTKVYSTKAENSGFGTSRTFGLGIPITAPATPEAAKWNGWGTALKPAWEPIVLAMKPLDGTFAHNAEKWGVAGMNIDACRIGTEARRNPPAGNKGGTAAYNMGVYGMPRNAPATIATGRWPANLLLDEEAATQLDKQSGVRKAGHFPKSQNTTSWKMASQGKRLSTPGRRLSSSDGASSFFYCGKATKKERGPGNDHPTVKPLDLMKYLLTLLSTPDGGVILDPFAGSGTTLLAAQQLSRRRIGVELDEHYCKIAVKRLRFQQQLFP